VKRWEPMIIHPVYFDEHRLSPEVAGRLVTQMWEDMKRVGVGRMTEASSQIITNPHYAPLTILYLTAIAHATAAQARLQNARKRQGRDRAIGSILVAADVLELAGPLARTKGDLLQLAATQGFVGRLAKQYDLFETALALYLRSADDYVRAGRWEPASDAYYNLGLLHALVANKGAAVAWLHLSTALDALTEKPSRFETTSKLMDDIRANPSHYQSPKFELRSVGPGTTEATVFALLCRADDLLDAATFSGRPAGAITAEVIGRMMVLRVLLTAGLSGSAKTTLAHDAIAIGFGLALVPEQACHTDRGLTATFDIGCARGELCLDMPPLSSEHAVDVVRRVDITIGAGRSLEAGRCLVSKSDFHGATDQRVGGLEIEFEMDDRRGLGSWIDGLARKPLTLAPLIIASDEVD
jgi:hypothetical protein